MDKRKLDKDHYSASLYEGMMRSMEHSAGEPPTRRVYNIYDRLVVAFIVIFLVVASVWFSYGLAVRLGR